LSKEPDGVLVMTTCKCRENNSNLVMTRTFFDERLESKIVQGIRQERKRVVELIASRSNATSRDALIALIEGKIND
jgi:hypothetical protein